MELIAYIYNLKPEMTSVKSLQTGVSIPWTDVFGGVHSGQKREAR
jgi:hypothetical protein